MPRSVGCILNMLEQFSLWPFHKHFFIIPAINPFWLCYLEAFSKYVWNSLVTKFFVKLCGDVQDVKAWELWVPKKLKESFVTPVQVDLLVSFSELDNDIVTTFFNWMSWFLSQTVVGGLFSKVVWLFGKGEGARNYFWGGILVTICPHTPSCLVGLSRHLVAAEQPWRDQKPCQGCRYCRLQLWR